MPVLYRSLPGNRLVESAGLLKGTKLQATPSTFINSGLVGRLAGLYSEQVSGEPGNDGVNLYLRGLSPVVLVDGIPREPWSINPEQIASVTVLKDALSTAMLGIRGMNGAVLITTRKGNERPGFNMDLTAQEGISSPLGLPDPLSAYDYARLYNEALANDGKAPVYTDADLAAYKNGSDPYGHPNINWYDQVLKNQTPFSRYTLNAAGSNEAVHYFVSVDYLNQKGLFKGSDINTYSTNTDYQRYIFRSNVSVKLSKSLSMYVNLFGRIRDQNEPGGGTQSIFNSLLATPANAYPMLNPDSSLGGNVNFSDNIYGQSVMSGYTSTVYSDGYADLGVKYDMDRILKGLWVKGVLSYDLTINQTIDRSKNFETFDMLVNPTTGDTSYQRYGTKSDQHNTSNVTTRGHQLYAQASAGYSHSWNANHLDVLLQYNVDDYTTNSDLADRYQTLGANVQYSIQDRYLLQATGSYSGNSRYRPGDRFGFFPAVGAAWNIDQEDFFHSSWIDNLKLRASYGLTGNAVAGYYEYIDRYVGGGGYYFGTSVASATGIIDNTPRNVTTWEKGAKLDLGIDMGFLDQRAMVSVDYYRNRLTDLVQASGKNSGVLGWGTITGNFGKDRYTGLEITANWADHIGQVSYHVSANFSVSGSKVLYDAEPQYPYSWMAATNGRVDQLSGYVADGYITQAGEGPVVEGYASVPGDIKYKDLNGDGAINQFDTKEIGNEKPLLFYGADIGFSWKNFSVSVLLQGVAHHDLLLTGEGEWGFQNDGTGQAWKQQLGRWTPATAATATYPRLSIGTNVNNDVASSFWVRSGDYMRLKNAEVSYTFQKIGLWKIHLQHCRIFVNGLNLLTFSKYKQSDPETLPGTYPIQRVVNGGVSIKF
jgi:TonB-linked SusC/RagA family outer membrane protein